MVLLSESNGVERLLGCFNVSINIVLDQREGQSIVMTLNNAQWRSSLFRIEYLEGKQVENFLESVLLPSMTIFLESIIEFRFWFYHASLKSKIYKR